MALEAGAAAAATRLVVSDATTAPAAMVFSAFLRLMLTFDLSAIDIVDFSLCRASFDRHAKHDPQKSSVTVPIAVLGLLSRFLLAIVGTQRSENDSGACPASLVS